LGGLRPHHHRDPRRARVLLRRGVPPAIPRQESRRLLRARRNGRQVPDRAPRLGRRPSDGMRSAKQNGAGSHLVSGRRTPPRLPPPPDGPGLADPATVTAGRVTGTLTTHVLDTAHGRPAAGLRIDLAVIGPDGRPRRVKTMTTDAEGRTEAPLLAAGEMHPG